MQDIVRGFQILLRLLLRLWHWLLEGGWWRALPSNKERDQREVGCFDPPPRVRARPDPYIYSQQWLRARGLAITWDNPDFVLIDLVTGAAVPRDALQPNYDYEIRATIHNNSLMAAIGTHVHFEVHDFGAGTAVNADLGEDTVDVPGAGTAVARAHWHTPASGGHNCLLAKITHGDDANPDNNVGQHNTDVARPASPARTLRFAVANADAQPTRVRLEMDAYTLPDQPACAASFEERGTLAYLRRVQAAHDPKRFGIPEEWRARLRLGGGDPDLATARVIETEIAARKAVEVVFTAEPGARGAGTRSVNINVFVAQRLLGGVTALIPEET